MRPFWPSPINKIPGPKNGSLLFGNFPQIVVEQAMEPHMEWVKQFPDSPLIHYRMNFNEERVLIVDMNALKTILNDQELASKNFKGYKALSFLLGNGLVTLDGKEHTSHRKLISPAFKFNNIKILTKMFAEQTLKLMKKWDEVKEGEYVEVGADINSLTLNIIGLGAFGFDFSSFSGDANNLGQDASQRFANIISGRSSLSNFFLFFIPGAKHVPVKPYRELKEDLSFTEKLVKALIAEKKKNKREVAEDLLDLLLDAKDEETGESFTDDQLVNHVKTFLFAGHETTSTLVSWTFHILSQHPNVLQKVREELNNELGDTVEVTYNNFSKLVYLNAVIKETLRLFPPVAIVSRVLEKDFTFNEYIIPARTTITISPYVIHHHPKYWENTEEFIPERWLSENSYHPCQFIPFIKGPRNCIGERFAMMEGTVILAMLLRKYSFEQSKEEFAATKRRLRITMRPSPELRLKIKKV